MEPRLILQSDWDEAMLEHSSKAWISYKNDGKSTVYSSLYPNNICKDTLTSIKSEDGFNANLKSRKLITVSYDDNEDGMVHRLDFQAPDVTYSNIHDFKAPVIDVAVNNENLAVSVDCKGVANIWETTTGTVRRVLNGHLTGAVRAKFFPSGSVVLTGGNDMTLKIWSAGTGHCVATCPGHKGVISDFVFVEKGRNFLSTSSDGTAKLWDAGSQKCLATFEDNVCAWNCCAIGRCVCTENTGAPTQAEESGTGSKILVVGTERNQVLGFSVENRKKIFDYTCDSAVNCVSFVNEDLIVAGTEAGTLYLLDRRNISDVIKVQNQSRGAVKSLFGCHSSIAISTADGSCFYKNSRLETCVEFTGSDLDPVYRVSGRLTPGGALCELYTCCRDGAIRKYCIHT